jgi:hypothetical protein
MRACAFRVYVDDPRLTAMFAELLDEVTSDSGGLSALTGEA